MIIASLTLIRYIELSRLDGRCSMPFTPLISRAKCLPRAFCQQMNTFDADMRLLKMIYSRYISRDFIAAETLMPTPCKKAILARATSGDGFLAKFIIAFHDLCLAQSSHLRCDRHRTIVVEAAERCRRRRRRVSTLMPRSEGAAIRFEFSGDALSGHDAPRYFRAAR